MAERISVLGVGVHAIDLKGTLQVISDQIVKKGKGFICLAPAHNVMACHADPNLRAVFNRNLLTVPDGVGVVWLLRLLGYRAGRVYGPDLLLAVCERGQKNGWRHFFLGGAPGVAHRLIAELQNRFPKLKVADFYSLSFEGTNANETQAMVRQINASRADIVWVGLGSPKQERWMAEFRPLLNAPLLIGVGAAFDFLSGTKPQAPVWIQRIGLEWLFRLVSEPRRLWRRYANYPLFVLLAMMQILGLKRYPLEETK